MKTNADDSINAYAMGDISTYQFTGFGLTKREYFAAMAMQGLCANQSCQEFPTKITESAVFYADQLIEKLNKDQS